MTEIHVPRKEKDEFQRHSNNSDYMVRIIYDELLILNEVTLLTGKINVLGITFLQDLI